MAEGPGGRRIPAGITNKLGRGKLEKGRWKTGKPENEDSLYLIAWDFSEKCTKEKCPMFDICEYKNYWKLDPEKKNSKGATDRCMLQQKYMRNVLHAFMENMKKSEMGQEEILKMGYHLLPLYSQLFKFKCWEYANQELVYISEKGTPKVHPVYKEIREIIKTITSVWKDLKMYSKTQKDPKDVGDSAFIDALYSEENLNSESSVKGTGMDFDEEVSSDEESKTGTGMDFDQYSSIPDEAPKKKTWYKQKPKKRRRKRKSQKKEKKPMMTYREMSKGRDADETD